MPDLNTQAVLDELDGRGANLPVGRAFFVVVRTASRVPGVFDDWLLAGEVTSMVPRRVTWRAWPCTADPGLYWLREPMNRRGTAILAPGGWLFKLGSHRGKYPCLVQAEEVGVYRDDNRDDRLNPSGPVDVGYHGIELHRAHDSHASTRVWKWSAGCVVVPDPDDYDEVMVIAVQSTTEGDGTVPVVMVEEPEVGWRIAA